MNVFHQVLTCDESSVPVVGVTIALARRGLQPVRIVITFFENPTILDFLGPLLAKKSNCRRLSDPALNMIINHNAMTRCITAFGSRPQEPQAENRRQFEKSVSQIFKIIKIVGNSKKMPPYTPVR